MKTQCAHCHASFKVAEEHKGKNVKCPKCSHSFVIAPFIESTAVEVCSSCGRQIGKQQGEYVSNGKVVCKECSEKLRKTRAGLPTQKEDEGGSKIAKFSTPGAEGPRFRAGIQRPLHQANMIGITVSILFLLGTLLTSLRGPRTEELLEYRFTILAGIAAGLCLLVRSFLVGFSFLRAVQVYWGAILLVLMPLLSYHLGLPSRPHIFLMVLVTFAIGGILVIWGYKPDKGLKKKGVAIILALFTGPLAWLYVYRKSRFKFWVSACLFLAGISPIAWIIPPVGFIAWGFLPFVWIWAIIDMAVRPRSCFADYGLFAQHSVP